MNNHHSHHHQKNGIYKHGSIIRVARIEAEAKRISSIKGAQHLTASHSAPECAPPIFPKLMRLKSFAGLNLVHQPATASQDCEGWTLGVFPRRKMNPPPHPSSSSSEKDKDKNKDKHKDKDESSPTPFFFLIWLTTSPDLIVIFLRALEQE